MQEESLLCLSLLPAWSSPSPTAPCGHCSALWCSVGPGIPKSCGVGILAGSAVPALPFSLTSGALWGPQPCSHICLSLLLGLFSCCLLPLRLGAHCCGHSLFVPGVWAGCLGAFSPALLSQCCREWRSRGWPRAGWGSSACPGVQPPSSCCLGGRAHAMCRSVCSVGLSDVLSHSWGLFFFKKCF